MQAGAGTTNCRNLMDWIKKRSANLACERSKKQLEQENDSNKTNGVLQFSMSLEDLIFKQVKPTTEENAPIDQESNEDPNNASSDAGTKTLDEQKKELFQFNKEELEAFDLETAKLGEESAPERKKERDELVQKHRNSVVDLVGTHYFRQRDNFNTVSSLSSTLPMTASVSAISQIACQLLHLCLDMQIFGGGILVAEAMSCYLKERIQRKRRIKANLEFFQQKQTRNIAKDMFPYESQVHDEVRLTQYFKNNH